MKWYNDIQISHLFLRIFNYLKKHNFCLFQIILEFI